MITIVEHYFRQELSRVGYPDMEVCFSLGRCQGDGMAFYGHIHYSQLAVLVKRLMPGKGRSYAHLFRAMDDFLDPVVKIVRNGYGYRYSHWNTMMVDAEDLRWPDEISEARQERYAVLWDELMDAVSNDIREVSKRLERDGYRLFDAAPYSAYEVREWNTANFTVTLTEMPNDVLDSVDMLIGVEPDDIVQSMLKGKTRSLAIKVEVTHRDTGTLLGQASLWGICCAANDATYGGSLREITHETILLARERLALLSISKTA